MFIKKQYTINIYVQDGFRIVNIVPSDYLQFFTTKLKKQIHLNIQHWSTTMNLNI